MSRLPWLKIGAVAALWAIIAGAALAGWMVGRSDAARQISELQRRLAADDPPPQSCGIEVELLDARAGRAMPGPTLLGFTLRSLSLRSPGYLHLREMLTGR